MSMFSRVACLFAISIVVAVGCSKKSSPTDHAAPGAASSTTGSAAGPAGAGSGSAPAAVAAGCTATSVPQSMKASCSQGKIACQEFTGSGFTADGTGNGAKEGCDAAKGTYSATEHCPTAGLVGRCLANCGKYSEIVTFYYTSDPQDKTACTYSEGGREPGTWFDK